MEKLEIQKVRTLDSGESQTYNYNELLEHEESKTHPLIALQLRRTSLYDTPINFTTEFIYTKTPE